VNDIDSTVTAIERTVTVSLILTYFEASTTGDASWWMTLTLQYFEASVMPPGEWRYKLYTRVKGHVDRHADTPMIKVHFCWRPNPLAYRLRVGCLSALYLWLSVVLQKSIEQVALYFFEFYCTV